MATRTLTVALSPLVCTFLDATDVQSFRAQILPQIEAEQAQLADLSEPLRRTQLERRQEKEQSRLTMRMMWDAQVKEEAKVATSQIPII